MCRRLSAPDDARCRRSRWAGAISRAHPPRGTRDRLSPASLPGRDAGERRWAWWLSSHWIAERVIDRTDARSAARYRQHRHDLNGFAREDREMRMVLEQLGGCRVRLRTHHHEGAHRVAHIRNAALRDLFGLAERSAHGENGRMVLFDPGLPGSHALLLLGAPLGFGKRHPRLSARTGFAAEKDRQIGV